jgi:hypothetical protein
MSDTLEEIWQHYIERAEQGDLEAARAMFESLVRFLKGSNSFSGSLINSPDVRNFLAARLSAALEVPKAEVGKTLNLGLGKSRSRKSKHDEIHKQFLEWHHNRQKELGLAFDEDLPSGEIDDWLSKHDDDIDNSMIRKWLLNYRYEWITGKFLRDEFMFEK